LETTFEAAIQRDQTFQKTVNNLTQRNRRHLQHFREIQRRPRLCALETRLVETLLDQGFCQVATPIIMSRGHLSRMTIDEDHPLLQQIYWIEKNRCLRPMLAPHLYYVSKDLLRLWGRPVRIFEIGPCFRKETQGQQHVGEFTMLNLVEYGTPEKLRRQRLKELGAAVMAAATINNYTIEAVSSEVYGETVDIVAGPKALEVGSAAMGPHPLDAAWDITETWVGIGFGLERLLMVSQDAENLAKFGRSLRYLDGIPLNI
jgi:pyrrolysyl-tRNA synthetase-like protein